MLRIDANIIWTIVNLIIFFLLIRIFLFKPIMKVIKEREELIQGQFDEAQKAQTQADALKMQYEDALHDAKEESAQIIESARVRAKAQSEEIVANAHEQADKMMKQTQADVERRKEQALSEVEGQIASLAVTAAMKIMTEATGEQTDEEIYQKYLNKVGEISDTSSN
ncbi:F0F1 ATP synthase subunit B [Eubacterium oxidoreducens]|uniref:ATP synthase subunit b n=1 Tax=Eubacterium oxidoreducens TaxID=1732 RepID=A0A1G6CIB7_EUBOX|nr:F0F1 ATP synthase subunit B [Eubacterium oxidoreducens]SDB32624.1 F-type H+-transporting ATPase subunit b [Eubacterium oxidoreducens]